MAKQRTVIVSNISRRRFLMTAPLGAAATWSASPRTLAQGLLGGATGAVEVHAERLDVGWQFRRGPTDGIWEVWRAEEAELWQPVAMPHCFNAQDACDPDQGYYRGPGWYRVRLAVKNPFAGGRTLLHFQGAGQTTTVWVGSELLGMHKGGYDEFMFDATEAIGRLTAAQRKNGVPVAVLCDNSPDVDRVPSDLSDFCLYGGLYRHVEMVYVPPVALEMVHLLPALGPDGGAQVSVRARLFRPGTGTEACSVTVEVFDGDGRSVHTASRKMTAWVEFLELDTFRLAAPQVWSPETPHLYRCRVTLATDGGTTHIEERFGVRRYEFVEHGPFMLNGQRVLLKGTHRHADHAGYAAAMPDDLVRRELQMIRAMGANFIRLAHYQQDRLVLDLCDELGLMVWEEVPWCRAGVGSAAFRQNAKAMLTHMIEQHRNHPSIILWGLGNEDDWPNEYPSVDEAAIRGFMTELRDLAHGLDGSRLTSFRRCDFARDIPDVYSPSIWAGWYRGNYREYEKTLVTERERVKRFIHIEWGADSQAGRHAEDPEAMLRKVSTGTGTEERGLDYLKTGGEARMSKDGDWSETYACNLFDWHLKTQEKLPWLTGSAQWIFKDFASPLRADDAIPNMNQKGVVERDLTKKESYFVFQSYWSGTLMAHIYGHTWPVRWGKAGEERLVKVYSNCETAELFVNGASHGIKHRDSQDFPAAGLRWNVALASGKNTLRVVAQRAGASVSDEIETFYQTEAWGAPSTLDLTERGRDGGVSTVALELLDGKGVVCLESRATVRFTLAGAGRLIDNLGTVHGSRVVQLCNGRAQISLTRTGGCVLGAVCDGAPAAFLSLA